MPHCGSIGYGVGVSLTVGHSIAGPPSSAAPYVVECNDFCACLQDKPNLTRASDPQEPHGDERDSSQLSLVLRHALAGSASSIRSARANNHSITESLQFRRPPPGIELDEYHARRQSSRQSARLGWRSLEPQGEGYHRAPECPRTPNVRRESTN